MENKKEYSSFEQINLDLKIYKIEKEIAFSKILNSLETTKHGIKQELHPLNIAKSVFTSLATFYNNTSIKAILTTYAVRFILEKFKTK